MQWISPSQIFEIFKFFPSSSQLFFLFLPSDSFPASLIPSVPISSLDIDLRFFFSSSLWLFFSWFFSLDLLWCSLRLWDVELLWEDEEDDDFLFVTDRSFEELDEWWRLELLLLLRWDECFELEKAKIITNCHVKFYVTQW